MNSCSKASWYNSCLGPSCPSNQHFVPSLEHTFFFNTANNTSNGVRVFFVLARLGYHILFAQIIVKLNVLFISCLIRAAIWVVIKTRVSQAQRGGKGFEMGRKWPLVGSSSERKALVTISNEPWSFVQLL